jgi:hypothetical protein
MRILSICLVNLCLVVQNLYPFTSDSKEHASSPASDSDWEGGGASDSDWEGGGRSAEVVIEVRACEGDEGEKPQLYLHL